MFVSTSPRTRRQRGIAAVEFAIILPILISLIAFPIFFGRVFMYYTVAHKAAQNAAMYLATIPKSEMYDINKSAAARDMAENIAYSTIAELSPGELGGIGLVLLCNGDPCGFGAEPINDIKVTVHMVMFDEYFSFFTWIALHDGPLVLNARVNVNYLGQ